MIEFNLKNLVIVIGIFAALLALYCWAENSRLSSMIKTVQEVARCKSMEGTYAGGKCYVDGEEK